MKETLIAENTVETDPLTIAYLAIGAKNYFSTLSKSEFSALMSEYSGEANAIAHVIQNANYLDGFWDQHQQYFGNYSFAYEVVEPFGEDYFKNPDEKTEQLLQRILQENLSKEDYDGIYPPTTEPEK